MTAPLAQLVDQRETIETDFQQILDAITKRNAVVVGPISLDWFYQALSADNAEDVSKTIVARLDELEIPDDAALLIVTALRRAVVRHVLVDEPSIVDFVEEVVERVMVARVQAARLEAQHLQEHHDWVLARLPAMMHSIDTAGKLATVNDRWLEYMGYAREEVIGRRSTEFLTPESAQYAREVVLPAYFKTGRCDNVAYQFIRKDGTIMDVTLSAITDTNSRGQKISVAILSDVTAQLATERAAQKVSLQEEMIRSQREMLLAISTPLVPLGDGILLMPLVGDLEAERTERMMAVLLEGVVTHAAEVAILDVTGVPSMDSAVAEGLIGATKAVGLLGAEVILTGIGPSAARTLVELGVDLGAMMTKSTLREGLATARRRLARKH